MRVLAALATVVLCLSACHSPSQPTTCTYGLSPTNLTIGSSGGAGTVAVSTTAGCTWSARVDSAWITVAGGASGSGPGTVTLSVAANAGAAMRSGTVSIADQAVTVRQEALACTYALSPDSRQVDAAGATGTIAVTATANCTWTAASTVPWVVVTSGPEGQGSGQVAYEVKPNTDPAPRAGAIDIAGLQFTVSQAAAASCTVSLQPDDETMPASGGTGTFSVLAPAGCAWVATSQVGWIRVASPADGRGAGSQTVAYSVDANAGTGARTGTITVGQATFVVTEQGTQSCSYTVDPVAVTMCMYDSMFEPSIGLTTQPGCAWTAATPDAWITITSALAGSGPAQITFRVADNYGARREGTIQIRWPTPTAGQNVAVTQGGCTYTVIPNTVTVSAAGGTASVDVWQMSDPNSCGGPLQDRCVWTAVSGAPWITITTGSGQGDGTVRFTVAPNTTGAARTGTITVADKVVAVQQPGA